MSSLLRRLARLPLRSNGEVSSSSALRRAPRKGQALVEFGIVFSFLVMLMVGGAAVMITLFQTWSVERSVGELGSTMAVQGIYDSDVRDDFLARAADLGFIPDPSSDTLTITVTKEAGAGDCGEQTCTYSWNDTVDMNYGDLVSVRIVAPIQFPAMLDFMNDLLGDPNVAASWTGVSQRNGGDASTNPPPSTSGALRGKVTSAKDGEPLADVILTIDTGESAVSDSEGNYVFSSVPTGEHTVQASKAGYQNAVVDATIPPNTTITLNLQLVSLSRLAVVVLPELEQNLITNPDLEDFSDWSGTGSVFTSSTTVTQTAAAASADTYGGRISSTSGGSSNQGALRTVPGSFNSSRTYIAFAWVRAPEGIGVDIIIGQNNGNRGLTNYVGDGEWMPMWTTWRPSGTNSNPFFVIRTSSSNSINALIDFDEVIVADITDAELGATVTTEDGLVATEYNSGLYELAMDSSSPHIVRATNADGDHTGGIAVDLGSDAASAEILNMDVQAVPDWETLMANASDLAHWWRLNEGAGSGPNYASRVLVDDPLRYWRLNGVGTPTTTDYESLVSADGPTHYWPLDEDLDNYEQQIYDSNPVAYFPMDGSGSSTVDVISGNSLAHQNGVVPGVPSGVWDNATAFDGSYQSMISAESGLVNYYRHDGDGIDSKSGCNRTGGDFPTFGQAPLIHEGTSALYNGTTDEMDIPCSVSWNGAMTWEAWVTPTNVTKDQMFLTYGGQTSNYFRITGSKPFLSMNISGSQRTVAGNTTLVNGQTYFLVGTYDGSYMRIYVNGTLDATSALYSGTANVSACASGANQACQLGRWYDPDPRAYVGYLDEVAVYNRALPVAEVLEHYTVAKTPAYAWDTTPTNIPTGSTARTANLWYRSSRTLQGMLMDYGSAGNGRHFGIVANWNGTNNLGIWGYGSGYDLNVNVPNLSNGDWHMITAVYNGSTQTRLYFDGALVQTQNLPGALNTILSANGLTLGRQNDAAGSGLDDTWLDDLAIWDEALSATQISDIYNAAQTTARRTINNSSGLLNYWPLDDVSVGVARNLAGGSGTYAGGVGSAPPLTDDGGNSAFFDGSNDEVNITGVGGQTRMTMGAWIKPTNVSYGDYQMVITYGAYANYLAVRNNHLFTSYNVGGTQYTLEGSTALENGRIYQVASTYDGNYIRLYLDGQLEATSPLYSGNLTVSACLSSGGPPCHIGSWAETPYAFNGYIDEVATWNRALSLSEMSAIYDAGHGAFVDVAGDADLHVWGRNDDQVAALSRIGSSNDATRIWDGGLAAEYGDVDTFTGTEPYSFEVWFKPETAPGGGNNYQRLISSEATNGGLRTGVLLVYNNSGQVTFERWSNGGALAAVAASPGLTIGQWTHVVGTYDGSSLKLYLNGGLAAVTSSSLPVPTYTASLAVGAISDDTAVNPFTGVLDEAAVYDRAITGAEVFEHYTVGLDTFAEETGAGPAYTDGSTASSPPPFTSNSNASRDFDGNNDMAVAYVPELDGSTASVEWWGRWDAYSNNDDFWFEYSPNTNQISGSFYIDANASTGDFRVSLLCAPGDSVHYYMARPPAGSWNHYVVNIDRSQTGGDEVHIYVNGVEQSLTAGGTCELTGNFTPGTLYFMHRGGNQTLFGDGGLDEVAVYDHLLTSDRVFAHYTGAADLSFNDSIGAADDGAVAGATPGATGIAADDAFDFDGTGAASVDLPADLTSTFSVEAWVKPANNNLGYHSVISGRTPDNEYGFNLSFVDGDTVRAYIGDGDSWLATNADVPLEYEADTWYHVVYVITPTDWTAYIDGSQMATGSLSGGTPDFSPEQTMTLGNNGCTPTCAGPNAFVGIIDEVALYDGVLDDYDVMTHYLAGKP